MTQQRRMHMGRRQWFLAFALALVASVFAEDGTPWSIVSIWPAEVNGKVRAQAKEGGYVHISEEKSSQLVVSMWRTVDRSVLGEHFTESRSYIKKLAIAWFPKPVNSSTVEQVWFPKYDYLPLYSPGMHIYVETDASWEANEQSKMLGSHVKEVLQSAAEQMAMPQLGCDIVGLAKVFCRQEDVSRNCWMASFLNDDVRAEAVEALAFGAAEVLVQPSWSQVAKITEFDGLYHSGRGVKDLELWSVGKDLILPHDVKEEDSASLFAVKKLREEPNGLVMDYCSLGDIESVITLQLSRTLRRDRPDAAFEYKVVGRGFHQQMIINIHFKSELVDTQTVLVHVPLASTMYADLDELRRMERFGHFTLLSISKHIEIERPSSVSSQHAIAFQMGSTRSTNGSFHLEFPVHFRYQSPSEKDYYRPATALKPEVFLQGEHGCSINQQPDLRAVKSQVDAIHSFKDLMEVSAIHSDSLSRYFERVRTLVDRERPAIDVPVAYLPHLRVVGVTTLSITSLGSIILMYVALSSSRKRQDTPHSQAGCSKPKAS